MTISTTSSRTTFLGDGVTTSFAFSFLVNAAADLVVTYTDATGTDYVISSNLYTVSGLGVPTGGTVTYPTSGSAIATGTKLTLQRIVSPTQPISISNQSAMLPSVIEAALDRLTLIAQGFLDTGARTLRIGPTDTASLNALPTATARANSALLFDANGQPYAGTLANNLVGVATWLVNNFFNAATSAANACAAIGAASLAGINAFTNACSFSGTVDVSTGAGRLLTKTRTAGDNGTDAATTAFVKTKAESVVGGAVLRAYLAGLVTSNNAVSPNTKIDVTAGVCADDTNVQMLILVALTLDCGTVGANGLDAGALAINTWYHAFAIGKTDGTTALLGSTNLSAPTFPAGYTLKRRIASFKTNGSAQIIAFTQNGDEFLWTTPPTDQNLANSLGTTSTLLALSVPSGYKVNALIRALAVNPAAASVLLQSPDQSTQAVATQGAGASLSVVNGSSGDAAAAHFNIRTNTAQQIRAVANATLQQFTIVTDGWIDRRGREG